MKVIFFGTPEIAVPSLEFLINKDDIEVVAVVTQPDRPAGRGHKLTPSSVKVIAEKYNIPVFQPKSIRKEPDIIEALRRLNADVGITVAFGQILSQEVIELPRLGIVNLHASLLPKYRGANPIQWPVINGDAVTGVATMLTEIGVDTGPVLLTEKIVITENMDSMELYERISQIGPALLYKTITGYDNGTVIPMPQDESLATHAPKLAKEDGLIDWSMTSAEIHNRVRGMKPWPSAYTFFEGNLLKVVETALVKENVDSAVHPGTVISQKNSEIVVKTGDFVILVKKLQPAGKKVMDASGWYNGIQKNNVIKFENE